MPVGFELVSVVNSDAPQTSELVFKQLISSFFRSFLRNRYLVTSKFVVHLLNQNALYILSGQKKLSLVFSAIK